MKIAVLSGKGGTGKTTVSTNLALSISPSQYVDCDVEEPNGYLFIKPRIAEIQPVNVLIPTVDSAKCDSCGKCAKACQFNAIAVVKKNVLVFPEICHHCGACVIACPKDAITEAERMIGTVELSKDNTFMQGKLNVGEPISIPIIKKLKKMLCSDIPVILDCPPGASCSVVQSIEECDYCILVTEPSPFGLHDLNIAVELVRKMNLPFGVVINKASDKYDKIHEYCKNEGIEILLEIPFSREIARAYSEGKLLVQKDDSWKDEFINMYKNIERSIAR